MLELALELMADYIVNSTAYCPNGSWEHDKRDSECMDCWADHYKNLAKELIDEEQIAKQEGGAK